MSSHELEDHMLKPKLAYLVVAIFGVKYAYNALGDHYLA